MKHSCPASSCLLEMPPDCSAEDLITGLQGRHQITLQSERPITRTYLDTFDRRILEHDRVLELIEDKDRLTLTLRLLGSGRLLGEQRIMQVPRFATDLPPLHFRTRIEAITDIRALLPVAVMRSLVQRLDVSDAIDKRVLRLEIQRDRVVLEERSEKNGELLKSLTPRVQLLPLRGYEHDLKTGRKRLIDACNLVPLHQDPIHEALACQETKHNVPRKPSRINPKERSDVTVKALMRCLLEIMEFNESGIREDIDTECLHEFRIGLRRTRSLLGWIKKIFSKSITKRFRSDFAWLGNVTGPARDADVYLLSFDRFKLQLPYQVRNDLEPLRNYLQHKQRIEHEALISIMDSPRYRQLMEEWRDFLNSPAPRRPTPRNARHEIAKVSHKHIAGIYRKVWKEGSRLRSKTRSEEFHKLRKTCKTLRYLLEFFNDLHPAAAPKKMIKDLKALHDCLGAYQDLHVQQSSLSAYQANMRAEHVLTPKCDHAIDLLNAALGSREDELKHNCIRAWKRFARRAH